MRQSKDKRVLRHHLVISVETYQVKETTRRFKASRNTVRKWYRRWKQSTYDYNSLQDRSHRPHYSPHAVPEEERRRIIELKKTYKRLGAEQI